MLQGKWTLVSGELEGEEISREDLPKYSLEITDSRHRVTWANSILEGTHTIDESQSPMTIDSTDSSGLFKGMRIEGVLELDGNEFSICFAAPGESRPTDFTTLNRKAIVLHRWKRQA